MSLFGHKKKKTARTVALPSASPLKGGIGKTLHNRSLLGRLSLCFLAVVAMLCVVQGWRTEFPYRLGDLTNRAITAKIKFEIINQSETDRKKSQAAELVPPIFSHVPDPNLFSNLSAKLRANLSEVLQSESAQDLSAETQTAFGLTVPQATENDSSPAPEDMSRSFNSLKLAINSAIANSGEQTDTLIAEFERMIKSLNESGLVSPEELSRNKISSDQPIRVVSATNPNQPQDLLASDVLLPELLKETGRLGRSWSDYTNLSKIRPHLERWLMSQMQSTSTLLYNKEDTVIAREEAQDRDENTVYDYYDVGDILVEPKKQNDEEAFPILLDEEALTVLLAEYEAIQNKLTPVECVVRSFVVFFMLVLLAVLNGFYLVRNEPQLVKSAGRLGLFLGLLVFAVALSRFLWVDKWRAEIIPLLATVMVFAIAYNQKLATITALTLSLIVTLSTSGDLAQFVVLMSVAVTAVIPLNQVSARSSLIKVGFLTGALYFLISWGTGVIQSQSISDLWLDTNLLVSSLRGAGWCLVVGYLVAGSLPFIEPAFGMVTDMSLLELGDVSHPLLHELVRRAPGTYNHSMSVATIGETAADLIGANGLLVRVGAYFHDIGKMLKPQYFVENMTEGSESRHNHLAPAMSTLIIIGHVKDGVDLASQHNLPEPLINFIEQHHGTTLVEYFYHEAAKQADQQPDHKTDAEESLFRYPGPKPQSRESGVMMMADAVESASRTLSDPTPKRIESLVHEMTLKRLLDGQFDESSLTLSEIKIVENSLIKSLIGIYHGRIKYPEQRTA